jgi:flagellar hook-length control protein FliK
LTGQLQHIQPQQIPGLVLNNSFIQQAMSSQDLQQFMGQTKPAQTWMNLLHNGPGPQPDLSQFGIHPETRMSALDFFNRLGFDAQQIMAEMTQLKANLPLEGLHSYMVRAAALNKPAQNPQASAQSGNEQTSSAASPINGDLAKDPAATTTGMTTTGMTTTGMTTTGMTTTGMTTSTEQSGKMSPAQAMAPNPQGVYAQKAGQDPFQAITGRWDPNSVNQVVGPQGPLTPAGQNQQPGIDQQNIMAETQSMTQTTDNPENQPQSFAGPNSGVLGGSGLFKQTNGKNSPATKDPTMLPKLQGEPLPAGLSMNPEGRSRSSSQDEGFSGQRQDQSNASFWANPFQQAGTTRSRDVGQTGFQQQIMSPDLAQARADILQKAQMLVKDGGGSIRIDMGHQDLGKLDLALDLNQQDLELRLVTDSEKARELLSQELPRLKEALQEANINLKSVEIGLRSDNQWSHTDDDGRRHQGQSFHQDEYLEDGPLQVQRSRKFVQHRSIDPARLSQPHANGQIQIRV